MDKDSNYMPDGFNKGLLGKSFFIAVEEVLGTMAGFNVYEQKEQNEDSSRKVFDISGIMFVIGQINAAFSLSMSNGSARKIVSYMTGMQEEAITEEELYDSIAELVNMIAGNAKAQLHETEFHFRLTSPLVVSGVNHILIQKSNLKGMSSVYGNEDIELLLKFYIL